MAGEDSTQAFRGVVLTTQIVGIISGLFVIHLVRSKNNMKSEYDVIMLMMTIGLLIYNISFVVFVFENLHNEVVSWLMILGVGGSVCSYFFSLLLSYSVYSLLVYKEYAYLWDVKNSNFKLVATVLTALVALSICFGVLQLYSPVLRAYSALPLFGLFAKVILSLCSLGLYIKSEYHIRSQIRIEASLLLGASLNQRLIQTQEVVHSLFLYPLLQLICIVPLFITGLVNNFKVDEIHNVSVQSPMFAGFAFSYAIIYLDLFFILLIYMFLNQEALYKMRRIFCLCSSAPDKLSDLEDGTVTSTANYTDMDFDNYYSDSVIHSHREIRSRIDSNNSRIESKDRSASGDENKSSISVGFISSSATNRTTVTSVLSQIGRDKNKDKDIFAPSSTQTSVVGRVSTKSVDSNPNQDLLNMEYEGDKGNF